MLVSARTAECKISNVKFRTGEVLQVAGFFAPIRIPCESAPLPAVDMLVARPGPAPELSSSEFPHDVLNFGSMIGNKWPMLNNGFIDWLSLQQ